MYPEKNNTTDKVRNPELYIELDHDPELAPEGTMTVKYKIIEKTVVTNDDKSPLVRLCIEINQILDHKGTEVFEEEKSDHKMSEDMLDQMGDEIESSDDTADDEAKPTAIVVIKRK
jgi:hypothetical protein